MWVKPIFMAWDLDLDELSMCVYHLPYISWKNPGTLASRRHLHKSRGEISRRCYNITEFRNFFRQVRLPAYQDWFTAFCIYCFVYQCQISYSNLSLPVTMQLRWRAKGLSLIVTHKLIFSIHKHMHTRKHMHKSSQLENCLVLMCHVCEERDRLEERQ